MTSYNSEGTSVRTPSVVFWWNSVRILQERKNIESCNGIGGIFETLLSLAEALSRTKELLKAEDSSITVK